MLKKGVIIISLLLVAALVPNTHSVYNNETNYLFVIIALINTILFFKHQEGIYATIFRFDTLFLIGYFIVHFQIITFNILGFPPIEGIWVWINKDVVNYSTWLSTIILIVWILGAMSFSYKGIERYNYRITYNIIILDYLLLATFIIFSFLVGKTFFLGEYTGGNSWGGGATHMFLLLKIFIYLRIIYSFSYYSKYIHSKRELFTVIFSNKIFIIITMIYSFLFFVLGDRGPIMNLGIVILGAYSIYFKNIKKRVFFPLIIFSAIIFTILGNGRTKNTNKRQGNILEYGLEKTLQDENSNMTNELALSIRILNRAIDVVPTQHDYLYGSTFLANLVGILPFGGITYKEISGLPKKYRSSSYFFTYLGQGTNIKYGEGNEIIADLYVNFGIIGAIIIMFLFGYISSYLNYYGLIIKSHQHVIILLLLLASSIYLNRSFILEPGKIIFTTLIIDFFLVKKSIITNN